MLAMTCFVRYSALRAALPRGIPNAIVACIASCVRSTQLLIMSWVSMLAIRLTCYPFTSSLTRTSQAITRLIAARLVLALLSADPTHITLHMPNRSGRRAYRTALRKLSWSLPTLLSGPCAFLPWIYGIAFDMAMGFPLRNALFMRIMLP